MGMDTDNDGVKDYDRALSTVGSATFKLLQINQGGITVLSRMLRVSVVNDQFDKLIDKSLFCGTMLVK